MVFPVGLRGTTFEIKVAIGALNALIATQTLGIQVEAWVDKLVCQGPFIWQHGTRWGLGICAGTLRQ